MSNLFDWDLLQSFLAVARTGKLTSAARQLKIDHSTLGRRLTALEASLSTKLFERRVSGYTLTLQGEHLLARAEAMESTVLAIQSDVGQSNAQISGSIRIGAPDGFGTAFLAPVIHRLAEAQSGLDIDLVATPRNFSLSKREADIVISLSRPEHGRLHARKLTDYELGLYAAKASPDLWKDIIDIDDILHRPFISYIDDLIFTSELDYLPLVSKAIMPRIRSSNVVAQLQATAAGGGLCILPCFMANPDGRLLRLLSDDVSLTRSFWMVVHSDLRDLARIRVTCDFIADEVRRAMDRFLPQIPGTK